MKRALLLAAAAAVSAATFGCAVTDYPSLGVSNKSHGVIDCRSDDRIANTQQILEPATRELLYTNGCIGNNPVVTLNGVDSQDARDWNRFVGTHSFFGEAGVLGAPGVQGMYILASVKDLPDGSTRINNYFGPDPNTLSCVGAVVDGRYGAPEGVIVGDALGRQPGLKVDSVFIDSTGGGAIEFCGNVAALSIDRATNGFSTYWSMGARAYEGRLASTPVTRREAQGLASFLGGGTLTATVEGVTITARGDLQADGSLAVSLLSLQAGGTTYDAAEPIRIVVDPSRGGRTSRTHVTDAELVRLGQFALDSGLADRTIDLRGQLVPELGIRLPDASLRLSAETIRTFVTDHAPPTDGN